MTCQLPVGWMTELRMDQFRACLGLADDFLAGQWESMLVQHELSKITSEFEGSPLPCLRELLVALSPAQVLIGERSLPTLVVEKPPLLIRYRYCAGLLLKALAGLSLQSADLFDAQVKLFCTALSDLLEASGSFFFVAQSFLRRDAPGLLSQCLRRFHIADTFSRQGLLPKKMSVVLGMHRSGTSALSGMLAQAGLSAPKDALGMTENNLLGYWESESLVLSADAYIDVVDSHWSQLFSWPERWWCNSSSLSWVRDYLHTIHNVFDCRRHIVLKDPRLCVLLEAFVPCLSRSISNVDFLLMLRSPVEVVSSLCRAEDVDPESALHLWIGSVLRSERISRFCPRRIFTYSQLLESPQTVLESCCSLWGLNLSEGFFQEAQSFVSSSLHHQKFNLIRQDFVLQNPRLVPALQLADDIYGVFLDHKEVDFAQLDRLNRLWLQILVSR